MKHLDEESRNNIFLIDGTATGSTKQHLASLRNLGYGFSYLVTCDEVIQMLSGN